MAQPVAYSPVTSFLTYQATQPWFPGQNIDVELNNLKTTTDQIRTNLALIQRDDGALANGTVGSAQLDTVLAAAFGDLPSLTTVQGYATTASTGASTATAQAAVATAQAVISTAQAVIATAQATSAAASAVLAAASIGFNYAWSTNTAASDPGSGGIKGNNATIASITALYISETDSNSNNLAPIISDWGVSTSANKAVVRISKVSSPQTVWAQFYVTAAIADGGTWDTLTVTYKDGSGAFSNTDAVTVSAQLVGDKGTAGSGTIVATTHGVGIGTGATAMGTTAVMSDGQILVGQSASDPLPKTITGDVTFTAAGATAIKSSVSLTTPVLGVATATSINKMAITAPASSSTLAVADGKTATISNTLTFSGTDSSTLAVGVGGTLTASSSAGIFYDNIPQNSKSAAYTTVLADAQKHILHPSADTTARTFTIDSNANVAYPIGTAITFVNQASAGVLTIAITTDTMRLAGAGTTGSRTLAANGIATALKLTSTEWIISGTGLT